MKKKLIKYTLSISLIAFLGYHSVYFRKLDEAKNTSSGQFDAKAHARKLYEGLVPKSDSAIEIAQLVSLLKTEPANAFKNYSNALAIGNIRCFFVKGEGVVQSIDENTLVVLPADSAASAITIATEFVYGNALRDASKLVKLNDFSGAAELNSLSEELNKIVRAEVLPAFKQKVQAGNRVKFAGAIEMNQAHLNLASIEIVPVRLSIIQ